MGLDVYLYDGELPAVPADAIEKHTYRGEEGEETYYTTKSDVPSDKYPEHHFKKNYLRSSYNESGINSVARIAIGKDLYWVFELGEDYEVRADWATCRERAVQFRDELAAYVSSHSYLVATVTPPLFDSSPSITAQQALEMLTKETAKHVGGDWPSYSTGYGTFFLAEPLKVVAAIPGVGSLQQNGVHLVYRDDMTWYVQAAEIVIEFIDYATTLKDPVLHWSS